MTRDSRRAADSVAAATARWSWWLSSGACTYTTSASVSLIARSTTATVAASGVTVQSTWPPHSSLAPRVRAACSCSRRRPVITASSPGPFSPPVMTSMVTASPAAEWASREAPQPSSMSSGWAPTARTLRIVAPRSGQRPLARPVHEGGADDAGSHQPDGRTGAVALLRQLRRRRADPGRARCRPVVEREAVEHPAGAGVQVGLAHRGGERAVDRAGLERRRRQGRELRRGGLVVGAARDRDGARRGVHVADDDGPGLVAVLLVAVQHRLDRVRARRRGRPRRGDEPNQADDSDQGRAGGTRAQATCPRRPQEAVHDVSPRVRGGGPARRGLI